MHELRVLQGCNFKLYERESNLIELKQIGHIHIRILYIAHCFLFSWSRMCWCDQVPEPDMSTGQRNLFMCMVRYLRQKSVALRVLHSLQFTLLPASYNIEVW